MHLGLAHLFYNLYGLWYFGGHLECETSVKRPKFLITFFISGMGGALASLTVAQNWVGAVGASSSIAGILGLLVTAKSWDRGGFIFISVGWTIIGFVIEPIPVFVAHNTGLIVGLLLGIYWKKRKTDGFTN